MRMWGESVGRKEGREAREAIKLTETLATPSSVTQATPSPSTSDSMPSLTRKPFVPYCNTGVINIFHTPENCLLCARRTDNFSLYRRSNFTAVSPPVAVKTATTRYHHAASLSLSLDQSHCPTINTIKFLIESSKFIIQVQFVRREKIYNFVFDRILQLYLSRAVHYEIGTRVYRTQSRWTLSRSWHEWKTRRDCSSAEFVDR